MREKPNVLLIISDQQRFDTVAAAGYDFMITPNLDRLAREGVLFENAYSSNPVCMPARHDLLMGMPSGIHGFFQNCFGRSIKDYNVPTLPRIFSEHGYRTAAIGKMHFSPARMHHGYSELHLMEELPVCRQDDAYASFLKEHGREEVENIHGVRPLIYHEPQKAQVDGELYETEWIADRSIRWLKENNQSPFLLCVGYIKPHPPWDVPEKFKNSYANRKVPEPVKVSRVFPYSQRQEVLYGDFDSKEEKRRIREAYYSCISAVDDSVGKIISYLEATGELDRTLVIYTADHGEMLQDKGLYSKENPYEGAAHIPFLVRYPKEFQPGTHDKRLIDLTDIFPTCLSVTGLSYPEGKYSLYGASLTESDKAIDKDREYVFSASGVGDKRFVMCRDERYKYVYRYNGGSEECYDLATDPYETVNCIDAFKETERYKKAVAAVTSYEEKWGPEGVVSNGVLVKMEAKEFKPNTNAKYPLWNSHQFQNFTELTGEKRIDEFDRELNFALGHKVTSDSVSDEVWKEFEKGKEEYRKHQPMNI